MTVTWHVDDLKIPRKDSREVTKCIKHFGDIYGDRMAVHRGKVHDYLGMDLDFSSTKVLNIGMIKYIKKFTKTFQKKSSHQLLRQMLRVYLMRGRITNTNSYLKSKHRNFIAQLPNFCLCAT